MELTSEREYSPDYQDEEVGREGESDIEYIIMNLYSKMKNLEGKYIDLANFYKQELVKTSTMKKNQSEEDQRLHQHYGQSRFGTGGGITPSKSFERSVDMPIEQSLEDDMKQMLTMKASQNPQINFQQSPQVRQISEFQAIGTSSEQTELLKQQLQDALKDTLENIDSASRKELQILTSKQNEMYTLATKYNLPSNIRNESLGLWYDAKTKISQCMGDLKFQLQTKSNDLNKKDQSPSKPKIRAKQERPEQIESQQQVNPISEKAIADLTKDLTTFKRKLHHQQKQIQNLQKTVSFKEISMKDDLLKIQTLVKEVKTQLSNIDVYGRKDNLMMSGEKNPHMMSPFEKRIVNYQKSAEMRKQTTSDNNRSGSRGRPGYPPTSNTGTNFYQSRGEYMNPQIMPLSSYQQQETQESNTEADLRILKSKMRNLEYNVEDLLSKQNIVGAEGSELEKAILSLMSDALKFIQSQENTMSNMNSNQPDKSTSNVNKSSINDRSKSKSGYSDNQYNPISPNSRMNDSNSNFYSGQRQNLQDKKISELQRNNDQLFGELRKANEKYLNQKVESNKLKDEIQILQNALSESNLQLKKQQQQLLLDPTSTQSLQYQQQQQQQQQPGAGRQSIKKKTQVAASQRVDSHGQMAATSQSMGVGIGGRQNSNNSILLVKENEDLKKKVQDLEKECFTLTYYQQEMQKRGLNQASSINDPYLRGVQQECQDYKSKVESLCLKVQRFMFAMKRLQRAVNSKDKDTQIYKSEFEMNKKALENLVKEVKDQMENKQQNSYLTSQNSRSNISGLHSLQPVATTNHSMMATWDKRDQRFAPVESGQDGEQNRPQRNKSQNPHTGHHTNQMPLNYMQSQQHQQQQHSQRIDTYQQPNQQVPHHQQKGIVRPKNQQSVPYEQHFQDRFNETQSLELDQEHHQHQLIQSPSQELQFNKVLEEVKSMQEESEKQKQEIEDLKQTNENLLADKNAMDVQLKSKSINTQKLMQQVKASGDTIQRQDAIINEYKDSLNQIEQSQNLNKKLIQKIKTDLLIKEKELIHAQLSQQQQQDSSRGPLSQTQSLSQRDLHQELKLQQQISALQLTQLRDQLMERIQEKEIDIESQFEQLQNVISEKEEDISRLKKLFVEKLREIENSFVEISQEIVENESVQQEASRRMQNQNQLQQSHYQSQNYQLEKSIEQVIGKQEDEQREEELNQLVAANEDLLEKNSILQKHIRTLELQIKDLKGKGDKGDELDSLKGQHEQALHQLSQSQQELNKRDKKIQELSNEKKLLIAEVKQLTKNIEVLGTQYQSSLNDYEHQRDESRKKAEQEQDKRILFESESKGKDKLVKTVKEECKVIEQENEKLKAKENDYLSQIENLKQEHEYLKKLNQGANISPSKDNQITFSDDQERAKIESNPTEAANSYLRMLKATNKELAISQRNHQQLQHKYEELKSNMKELQLDSRGSVEQIMNLETRIFDLEAENERLSLEINKFKGEFKVDEESIRQQTEEYFKDKIQFKDSEIESLSAKYSRILENNQDLINKNNRLESNNQEILLENEQLKTKQQSLELELEMTKSNSERDLDQVIEQEKQKQFLEKTKMDADKAKLQTQMNEQIKTIENQKNELEIKINKKKVKIAQFKEDNAKDTQQKEKENTFLQNTLKKGFEQKLKDMQKLLEEEKKAKEEGEYAREVQLKKQQEEKTQLIQDQQKQKLELQEKYKKNLEQEQQKQGHLQQTALNKEQEMKLLHQKQIEEMEKKFNLDKQKLEQNLSFSEKDKLDKIKKDIENEHKRLLQQKEEEHLRKQQDDQQRQETEKHEIQQQYIAEKRQLEKINQQEIQLIQQKLKADQNEQEKKSKKQLSLVSVLQRKAREVLLKEVEEQKLKNDQEAQRRNQEIEQLIQKQKKEIESKENEKKVQFEELKNQIENQKLKEIQVKENEKTLAMKLQDKVREDLQKELEKQRLEFQQDLSSKQQELELLKHEQEELVKSMSQQQDKQTQELLHQKDIEKNEILRKQSEEFSKNEKAIKLKDHALQEQKEHYEQQLTDLKQQSHDDLLQKDKEIQKSIKTYEQKVKELQQQIQNEVEQSQEKLNALKISLDEKLKVKDKDLEKLATDKKNEIDSLTKKHATQIETLNADKLKQNKEAQELIQSLQQDNEQLLAQVEDLQNQIKQLSDTKEKQIKTKELELKKAKDQHDRLEEELRSNQEQEIQDLKQKLEEDHQKQLKKKDQEKTLFEKMQEKFRTELQEQLEEKEKERLLKQKVIENLEKEIVTKEKDIEKERVDQQELIDQMGVSMKQIGQQKINLERENEKIKKELDSLKKSQQESEKEILRDLREKLQSKEKAYDDLLKEKQTKEQEATQYKQMVKEKETEISNLEKDLDQFVKESEDDKQQHEELQGKINTKLEELQQQKSIVEKEKKEVDLQNKMKEGLLKQLQEKLTQQDEQLKSKDIELERVQEIKNQSQSSLEKQLKDLQKKYNEDISKMEREKNEIQDQVQQIINQKQIECDSLNTSVQDLEQKLTKFEIDLQKLKHSTKQLDSLKELNDSIIEGVVKDSENEVIGDMGNSKTLQYCKRVKYLDKAWILVNKNHIYYWVDQEKIPVQKIQKINVEQLEDTQGKLQERLDDLIMAKEYLMKMMQESDSNRSDKLKINTQRATVLTSENKELRAQLQEAELNNNQLQQNNLQLKQKIKELNDMIFGLTDTDKSHESVKKIFDMQVKNEEMSKKLLNQYDVNKQLEHQLETRQQEIDKLKRIATEMDDSFAKGGMSVLRPENFNLEASSIEKKDDEDGYQENDGKVRRLETELEELQEINQELEKLNKTLKLELVQLKKSQNSMSSNDANEKELQDSLKHTRGILIKFLEKTPISSKENEDLLTIVFSMMFFTKEEIAQVQKNRNAQTEQNVKNQTKKGVFGMFGKGK